MPNENDPAEDPAPLPEPLECFARPGAEWTGKEIDMTRDWIAEKCFDDMLAWSLAMISKRYPHLSRDVAEEIPQHFFEKPNYLSEMIAKYDPGIPDDGNEDAEKPCLTSKMRNWLRIYLCGGTSSGGIANNYLRTQKHVTRKKTEKKTKAGDESKKEQSKTPNAEESTPSGPKKAEGNVEGGDTIRMESLENLEAKSRGGSSIFADPKSNPGTHEMSQDMETIMHDVFDYVKKELDRRDQEIFETYELPASEAAQILNITETYVNYLRTNIGDRIKDYLGRKYPEYFTNHIAISFRKLYLAMRKYFNL